MIRLTNTKTYGWEAAIRGMRNPMNSWEKSDSWFSLYKNYFDWESGGFESHDIYDKSEFFDLGELPFIQGLSIGPNDHDLMMKLAKGGSVHAKYRRMINVTVDILAPLYWWKEFDTYKVGTVANSCSTMHKIHAKEFTLDDFSHEHLTRLADGHDAHETAIKDDICYTYPIDVLWEIIDILNHNRAKFLETKDKRYWWQMIQLLPSSYNQLRTVQLNYEVLSGIYISRKDHKLDEWREFCEWMEKDLPHSEIITLKEGG